MSEHMTPDEFRRYGYQVIDWIADYQQRIETLPVLSPSSPGAVRALSPEHPPAIGEDFAAILTHTTVNGQVAIRLAIGSVNTERRHVEKVWSDIQAALVAPLG